MVFFSKYRVIEMIILYLLPPYNKKTSFVVVDKRGFKLSTKPKGFADRRAGSLLRALGTLAG